LISINLKKFDINQFFLCEKKYCILMSTQIIFSLSYVPFVIFIALSCIYEGKTGILFKRISIAFAAVATISYLIFINNLIV